FSPQDRTFTSEYNDADDTLKSETLTGGGATAWTKSYGYDSPGQNLGKAVNCASTGTSDLCNGGSGGAQDVVMRWTHRASSAFVESVSANNLTIEEREAERNTLHLTNKNSSINDVTDYDAATGLATTITSTGGTGGGVGSYTHL